MTTEVFKEQDFEIFCEVCGKKGLVTTHAIAPPSWFYSEVVDDDEPDELGIYTYVCSQECKDNFWFQGPGKLSLNPLRPERKIHS